jgi:2-dehydro-3-deoxyglucarate aldolase/4-hydroxy-2-oxoheptanedioate aldolase
MPDPVAYCEEINKSAVVICQIESETGVRNAEAIAAVDGVDVLWVGHYDLTVSMGIAGQFQHERFLDALNKTVAGAKAHGRARGIQPGNWEQAQQWRSMGFNVISWGADIGVYRGALQVAIQRLRSEAAAQ